MFEGKTGLSWEILSIFLICLFIRFLMRILGSLWIKTWIRKRTIRGHDVVFLATPAHETETDTQGTYILEHHLKRSLQQAANRLKG